MRNLKILLKVGFFVFIPQFVVESSVLIKTHSLEGTKSDITNEPVLTFDEFNTLYNISIRYEISRVFSVTTFTNRTMNFIDTCYKQEVLEKIRNPSDLGFEESYQIKLENFNDHDICCKVLNYKNCLIDLSKNPVFLTKYFNSTCTNYMEEKQCKVSTVFFILGKILNNWHQMIYIVFAILTIFYLVRTFITIIRRIKTVFQYKVIVKTNSILEI